jgi:molybdopterin synthase catalytic subunit
MIAVTEDDFSIEDVVRDAKRPDAGAIVTFIGTVRDDDIEHLELEAYKEAAVEILEEIRDEAVARFGLLSVDIVHRVGKLSVCDNIVLIVCSAGHRAEAFDGCRYIIEELKVRAPIWKKEIRANKEKWQGV